MHSFFCFKKQNIVFLWGGNTIAQICKVLYNTLVNFYIEILYTIVGYIGKGEMQ